MINFNAAVTRVCVRKSENKHIEPQGGYTAHAFIKIIQPGIDTKLIL